MMELFLETAPPVFETLRLSLENADWAEVKSSAHWLRGGACRMIAPDLQEHLETIENACAAPSPAVTAEQIRLLSASFEAACHVAESWLAEDRAYAS